MVDTKSVFGSIATIVLGVLSEINKNDILFAASLLVAASTIWYNVVKIKETKKK